MDRAPQPAMPPGEEGTRPRTARSSSARPVARPPEDDDRRDSAAPEPVHDLHPLASMRALKRGWALIRWGILILAVGVGIAALVAIVMAALFALVNASI
jgi:hypothetical protein